MHSYNSRKLAHNAGSAPTETLRKGTVTPTYNAVDKYVHEHKLMSPHAGWRRFGTSVREAMDDAALAAHLAAMREQDAAFAAAREARRNI